MSRLRLPAEWEPQSGVMLTWPYAGEHNYWGENFTAVERAFIQLATAISRRERVLIVCNTTQQQARIRAVLADNGATTENLLSALAPTDDVWARDHGPITVLDNDQPRLLDFTFNGWGNKFPAVQDNRINRRLAAQKLFGKHPLDTLDFVLEGGAIESDGQGTLLTTAHCLLTDTRNAALDRSQIELRLKKYFGLERVLWLEHGDLAGDDTDGHIDTLARFCDAGTIAYVRCDDPEDEHYEALSAMQAELRTLRSADDSPYNLIALPLPGIKTDASGQRLPATYANFLIINDAVLVPTYRDPLDDEALRILARCFPAREIIGIDCLPLIHQYGSLHCVTMQLPAGVLA